MRAFYHTGLFAALLVSTYSAQAADGGNVSLSLGMREDYLRWSFSDFDINPGVNIRSELTWRNLHSQYLAAHARYEIDRLIIAGTIGRGIITSGKNQDSDYDLGNREAEFSRSNNQSDGDVVTDREVTVGLSFLENRLIHLSAGTGFASHTVSLLMTDGYQTIATAGRTPAVGPIDGLRSTYEANLSGPLVWFGARWQFHSIVAVDLHAKTGFYAYSADADWNLRTDFEHPRSFSQHTNGRSDLLSLSLDWSLSSRAALLLNWSYHSFRAEGGYTRFYKSNGATPEKPINEVKFWMRMLSAGVAVRF